MIKKENIVIAGAGLVGSLLAIYLRQRGYSVALYERRPDMRQGNAGAGRSINLALSNRGIRALHEVGLADELKQTAIPMHGRMVHHLDGSQQFHPYGKAGQFINSVSRGGLNEVLLTKAEQMGVQLHFEHKAGMVDFANNKITFETRRGDVQVQGDKIIGADGAYSGVRGAFQTSDRFDYAQTYIEHGYKELTIPPDRAGNFRMEKNALHIWPRESFMLIALPNPDGTFTCTLFFPFEGGQSFSSLQTDEQVMAFFQKYFADAVPLMPTLLDDFRKNPVSSLVTVRCWPWVKQNAFLIGDAAHGIVPFFGQGMNAGFEDCRVLNGLLDAHSDNWNSVLPEYQQLRKPDGDAIAQLALDNFIEMRDLVDDPAFILRKKIEAKLHELYPTRWIPLYSMVTFYDEVRYSEALHTGRLQKMVMEEVLAEPGIETNWPSLDFESIVLKLEKLKG